MTALGSGVSRVPKAVGDGGKAGVGNTPWEYRDDRDQERIDSHDRVVAELGPPRPGRGERVYDVLLAEAVREGWISPPLMAVREPPPAQPVAPLAELLDELDRDRGDR